MWPTRQGRDGRGEQGKTSTKKLLSELRPSFGLRTAAESAQWGLRRPPDQVSLVNQYTSPPTSRKSRPKSGPRYSRFFPLISSTAVYVALQRQHCRALRFPPLHMESIKNGNGAKWRISGLAQFGLYGPILNWPVFLQPITKHVPILPIISNDYVRQFLLSKVYYGLNSCLILHQNWPGFLCTT